MKNLKPYSKNAFDVHKKRVITKATKDVVLGARLALLSNVIKKQYELYEINFKNNTLEELTPSTFNERQKADLAKLYSFRQKVIQEIKKDVTTTDVNRIISTCQNCTINEVNSF
ncbi:MAG TPA: hypothetical protein VGO21_03680, partial [Candidatus Paceibacterota bacterium]|nr:hypothetical protein [Candidatus Paceibacterota bacterium]